MKERDREEYFLGKVQDLLNEGAQHLDPRTRERLERVRIRALSAAEEKRGFFTPLRWIMVGGFATATVAATALLFWLYTSPPGALSAKQIEDLEILTSREQMDFYQNLDFYRWLATEQNGPGKGKTS